MNFDVSRDFLDGILLQHPTTNDKQQQEIRANADLQFLPSSPDKTMHTAVIRLTIQFADAEQPIAQGGWRFLFSSDEAWDAKEDGQNPFLRQLLVAGSSKLLAVLNPLCMHANMPLLPIDAAKMFANAPAQEGGAPAESSNE